MSDEPASRSPEASEVLRAAITYFLDDTHTAMPACITEYDPAKQMVSAQPLIQRRAVLEDGSEILETLPECVNVPVAFPRTQNFFLTFPLQVGDIVMLHFVERSIDNWLAGEGEVTDPDEFRMHDLSDAFAVPGVYPFNKAIKDIDDARLCMGHDEGGMQIHIAKGKIEVTEEGSPQVHVPIAETLENFWTGTVKPYIDAHMHPTGMGPSGPPVNPAPPWDAAINSTKVSIPDG